MSEQTPMHQDVHVLDDKKLEQSDEPPMFTVVIHNDDFTPMAFVIELLMVVFNMSYEDAELITMNIHSADKATVGRYTHEVAESKAHQLNMLSKENEHPLLSEVEKL